MPTATNGGVSLYYEADGAGEPVAFVADAGLGAWSWAWQHPAVAGPFEAIVPEPRGVGRSDAPGPDGDAYSVATLAADLEAVLAAHGARRAHLVGLGLGGMVALRHALDHDRAATLTLAGTAADPERIPDAVRERLRSPEPDDWLPVLVGDGFRAAHPDAVDRMREWSRGATAAPAVRAAHLRAAEAFDVADHLHEVTLPALVCHGTDDRVWPVEAGRRLAEDLPRGEFLAFPDAGHLVTVERSRPVNDALLGHLEAHGESAVGD